MFCLQWGSEIQPFIIWRYLKDFKLQFSNGRALAIAIAIVPTIQKLENLKSRCLCPDFKWFLTKWGQFVRISNGWASGFHIPFEIQTICNPS